MKKYISITALILVCFFGTAVYTQTIIDPKLLDAIKKLDVEGVRSALESGADPNAVYSKPRGMSAIVLVVSRVAWLPQHVSFSHEEVEKRIVEILILLFNAGAKIQWRDKEILYFPAAHGFPTLAKFLLTKGANPNQEDCGGSGLTPVEIAETGGHYDVAKILIKYGGTPADPKVIVQERFIEAAFDGDILEMKKALKNGARINETSKSGTTALHNATSRPDRRAVLFLLEKGAAPNLEGKRFGVTGTPLHLAAVSGKRDPMILEILLEAGAFVSARNKEGKTPLHYAAEANNLEGAMILIKAGAKVMPKDNKGWTPFDYAESGEMIKLLKAHGAKEQ